MSSVNFQPEKTTNLRSWERFPGSDFRTSTICFNDRSRGVTVRHLVSFWNCLSSFGFTLFSFKCSLDLLKLKDSEEEEELICATVSKASWPLRELVCWGCAALIS